MSSKLQYKQAANVERRTWDRDTYEAKAKARQDAENGVGNNDDNMKRYQGNKRPLDNNDENEASNGTSSETKPPREEEKEEFQAAEEGAAGPWRSERAFLKSRRGKVDLDSKVGTTEIINPDAAAASSTTDGECVSITDGVTKGVNGVGWHCKVCDCFLKDSLAYLDHINGRKHQRKLGYSMRVEKSTTNEVVSKLDQLARDRKAKMDDAALAAALGNNNKNGQGFDDDEDFNPFDEMVRKKDQDAAQRKAERKRRRAERKKKARGEVSNSSNRVGGSNTAKEAENVEEKFEKGDEGKTDEEQDNDGANPDLMAMMGFTGFS